MTTLREIINAIETSFEEVDTPRNDFALARYTFDGMKAQMLATSNQDDRKRVKELLSSMQNTFVTASWEASGSNHTLVNGSKRSTALACPPTHNTTLDTIASELDKHIEQLKRILPRNNSQKLEEDRTPIQLPLKLRSRAQQTQEPSAASTTASNPETFTKGGHSYSGVNTTDTARIANVNIYGKGQSETQLANHKYNDMKGSGNSRMINGDCYDSDFMLKFME